MSSAHLAGLESSLELLDLSGNNITNLPNHLFQEFDFLRTLMFRENRIDNFSPGIWSLFIYLFIYLSIHLLIYLFVLFIY